MALALSMAGLLSILGFGGDFSLALNAGDVMALVSGIVFTIGAMQVRQTQNISVFEQVFAFFFFGAVVSVALFLLFPTQVEDLPSLTLLSTLLPWFFIMAVFFLIPVMSGIYWGSSLLDPGRLGILLQLEVIVGITSAALLSGEPFGWREFIGTVLVVGAGLVEVIGNRSSR